MRRKLLYACLVLAAGVLGVLTANLLRDTSTNELQARGALLLPHPREVAPFRLVAHDGSAFTHASLEGHWTLLFFGYTFCPDICPTTMAQLRRARDLLDAQTSLEFEVVMVSVDPERDTPARLGDYVTRFSPDFIGVTGTPEAIAAFAHGLGVAFSEVQTERPEEHLVQHSGQIVVLNPRGQYFAILKPPHRGDNIAAIVSAIAGGS